MIKPAVEEKDAFDEQDPDKDQVTELLEILAILITEKPTGFSEHQLLGLLQKPPYSFFASDALKDPLILFQTHFLLFHCLYRLKGLWHQQGRGLLEISALSIRLKVNLEFSIAAYETSPPLQKGNQHQTNNQKMINSDPLASYYLDWSHFTSTKSHDVEALLTSFWQKVFIPAGTDSIQQALILMELESPIPTQQLKVQYRRLAQRHHPDKGGDSERFKKICQAFHQLKQHNLLA